MSRDAVDRAEALLPCPFCGGEPIGVLATEDDQEDGYCCDRCGAYAPTMEWNCRALPAVAPAPSVPPDAALDRLAHRLEGFAQDCAHDPALCEECKADEECIFDNGAAVAREAADAIQTLRAKVAEGVELLVATVRERNDARAELAEHERGVHEYRRQFTIVTDERDAAFAKLAEAQQEVVSLLAARNDMREAAEAELSRLRADTARLDWLNANAAQVYFMLESPDEPMQVEIWQADTMKPSSKGENIRVAVDAARAALAKDASE